MVKTNNNTHEKFGKKHVVIVFYNQSGRLLLQHRTPDATILANFWALFGGKINPGESSQHALVRETKEELGIKLSAFSFFRHYRISYHGKKYTIAAYIAPLRHSPAKLKKQQSEGRGLGLFTEAQTKHLKIAQHDRKILRDIYQYLKSSA